MATKMQAVSGSYSQTVKDSGDGQNKAKFTKSINQPTDKLKKPSTKAQSPKTISEHRSRP